MFWKKVARKALIVFAMPVFILAVFALLSGIFDSAIAPEESAGDAEPGSAEAAHNTDAAYTDEPDGRLTVQEDEPFTPADDDYITVRMELSDIHRGNLLLINHDHVFEIPDKQDFVSVSAERTPSYNTTGEDIFVAESVIEPLNDMMDSFYAETNRNTVVIISAYRGYDRQQEILNGYVAQFGSVEALRYAALPGYSEHHAGLAIDFGYNNYGVLRTFLGTGVNAWFEKNSFNFGFILRFPSEKSNITETVYEPWHFRYVGQPHAFIIRQNGWCLEEYIEFLGAFSREEPFTTVYDDEMFEIYFSRDTEILIPFDCEFDISGNNIDGFIVTIKTLINLAN